MKIELITKENNLLVKGIEYFWGQWGNKSNFDFYRNCIEHSTSNNKPLPKFYVMLDNNIIIGSYALLTNDIISRQDLMPWFACLFVNKEYRNKGFAEELITHGLNESQKKGFNTLYLSTDLKGFYEKKGWDYHSNAFGVNGNAIKVYSKKTN